MNSPVVNRLVCKERGRVSLERPLTRRSRRSLMPIFSRLRDISQDYEDAIEYVHLFDKDTYYQAIGNLSVALTEAEAANTKPSVIEKLSSNKRAELIARMPQIEPQHLMMKRKADSHAVYLVKLAIETPPELDEEAACVRHLLSQRGVTPGPNYSPNILLGIVGFDRTASCARGIVGDVRQQLADIELPTLRLQPLLVPSAAEA